MVHHAYHAVSYILANDNPIEDGETVDGIIDGQMSREIQWKCQYEDSLIKPPRGCLLYTSWSGIRNKLENDYLCPALRGHIQYFATSYSKSADHEGRAAIRMDGVEVLRSNYYTYFENVWTKFHHLRSTTLKDCDSAKEAINQAHAFALEQGTFDQKVFYEAFGIFDNQSIEKSLVSEMCIRDSLLSLRCAYLLVR